MKARWRTFVHARKRSEMTYEVDIDNAGRTVCDVLCTECQTTTEHYINDRRLMCKECLTVTKVAA